MPSFWNDRTFCLVTGASRGIGQAIAVELAQHLTQDSLLLLLARNQSGLNGTQNKIHETAPKLTVKTASVDLGSELDQTSIKNIIETALIGLKPNDFKRLLLIHNAAIMGDMTKYVLEYKTTTAFHDLFKVNVYNPTVINSQIFEIFGTNRKNDVIVNITSSVAVTPLKSWGPYSMSRAAREMYFNCLALENEDTLKVLHYEPGLVDSDAFEEAANSTKDVELRNFLLEAKKTGQVIQPEVTAKRLAEILSEEKFKSSDRVLYPGK